MRIQLKSKLNEEDFKDNSVRVVERFLLTPKILNKELRWLEKTEWIQFIDCKAHYYDGGGHDYTYRWKDLCWCDSVPDEYFNEGRLLHNVTLK